MTELASKIRVDMEYSTVLRFSYDKSNPNWTPDPVTNYLFLKGVRQHLNNKLQIRGSLFVNDVLDSLAMPRMNVGTIVGWVKEDGSKPVDLTLIDFDGTQNVDHIDFQLDVDGVIYDRI